MLIGIFDFYIYIYCIYIILNGKGLLYVSHRQGNYKLNLIDALLDVYEWFDNGILKGCINE